MQTYGQLIHVEDFYLGIVHYRIAVFRVQGGLHAAWSCDTCLAHNGDDAVCQPTIEECVANAKRSIEQHDRDRHAATTPQT